MDEDGPVDRAGEWADVVALVSDETRLRILLELVAHRREAGPDATLSFSELRKRTGRRDSANFNYHLDKLRGRFVTEADDGYALTFQGVTVVTGLLAGAFEQSEPRSIDPGGSCQFCDAPLEGRVADGVLTVTCPAGHNFRQELSPGAITDRDAAAVLELASVEMRTNITYVVAGTCPLCYGGISLDLRTDPEVPDVQFLYVGDCDRCGQRYAGPPAMLAFAHPAVVGFYYEHGLDVTEYPYWEIAFPEHDIERLDDSSYLRVEINLDGDSLWVRMDGDAQVVDVERVGCS